MSNQKPVAFISFAPSLFAVAWRAAERARETPQDAMVALLFSAATIEGYVNELLENLAFIAKLQGAESLPPSLRALHAVLSELEDRNAQLHLKVQVIASLLTGKPFDKSTIVYQDFDLLLKLRNALVHLRPDTLTEEQFASGEPVNSLIKRLVSRGVIEREDALMFSKIAGFGGMLYGERLARWAVETAQTTADTIGELFPDQQWRSWAKRRW